MTRTITMIGVVNIAKLQVILVQSEGDPEIDLVDGEVVARETFSILTTTAVIRPNTIINLFLGRTKSSSHGGLYLRPIPSNAQHADWLNAILPRNYITYRPILLEHKCGHTTFVLGGFFRNGHTTFVLGGFSRNGHTTFVSCKIRHEKTFSGYRAIVLRSLMPLPIRISNNIDFVESWTYNLCALYSRHEIDGVKNILDR